MLRLAGLKGFDGGNFVIRIKANKKIFYRMFSTKWRNKHSTCVGKSSYQITI